MNEHPIARVCPRCGSASFLRVRAKGPISFTDDRKCKECGTRYTPPTPRWAAIVFIILGLLIGMVSAVVLWAEIPRDKGELGCGNGLALGCMFGCFLLGIRCVIYGARSLYARPAGTPPALPKESRDRPAVTKAAPEDGFTTRGP